MSFSWSQQSQLDISGRERGEKSPHLDSFQTGHVGAVYSYYLIVTPAQRWKDKSESTELLFLKAAAQCNC